MLDFLESVRMGVAVQAGATGVSHVSDEVLLVEATRVAKFFPREARATLMGHQQQTFETKVSAAHKLGGIGIGGATHGRGDVSA